MNFSLDQAIDVLGRTPAALTGLLSGLGEEWSEGNEGPETFSPFDVVGHLIDGEETDWIVRAQQILQAGPDVTFAPYDRFRHKSMNTDRSLSWLLSEFASLRSKNLALLKSWHLKPVDLKRTGIHPSLGRVTLGQLLSAWVVHDLGHIAQVARVMAKQYQDEIGPWREYLPVVDDRTT